MAQPEQGVERPDTHEQGDQPLNLATLPVDVEPSLDNHDQPVSVVPVTQHEQGAEQLDLHAQGEPLLNRSMVPVDVEPKIGTCAELSVAVAVAQPEQGVEQCGAAWSTRVPTSKANVLRWLLPCF